MSDTIIYDKRLLAHIVLEAETPLVISSGGKTALTDSAILKDINGYPYIPGTTIAGILRHCLGEEKAKDFFGLKDKKTTKGSKIIFSEGKIVGLDGKVLDGIVNGDTIFPLKIARPPTVFVRALGESPALGHAARTAVFERRVRQIL